MPHPFAASCDELIEAWLADTDISLAPGDSRYSHITRVLWLPTLSGKPVHSTTYTADANDISLVPWRVQGLQLTPAQALILPAALAETTAEHWASDMRHWADVALFTLSLLARQRFMPVFEALDQDTGVAGWMPVLDAPEDAGCLQALERSLPCSGMCVYTGDIPNLPAQPVRRFVEAAIDQTIRDCVRANPFATPALRGPSASWIEALLTGNRTFPISQWKQRTLSKTQDSWQAGLNGHDNTAFRSCFRLIAPDDERSPWTLEYLFQAMDDPSLLIPASEVWRTGGGMAAFLQRRMNNPQERLLKDLGRASRFHIRIHESLSQPQPDHADFTIEDAYLFLRETAALLAESGFGVLVPEWWRHGQHRLSARIRISSQGNSGSGATRERPAFGMDTVLQFRWNLALGDEVISPEEFERLVLMKQPLVQIRGQWVEFDPSHMQLALQQFQNLQSNGGITARDILRARLGGDNLFGLEVDAVDADGWIGDLLTGSTPDSRMPMRPSPDGFQGVLRPYQERGYAWLAWMRELGLGACLADDMGLGKTIQLIAFLLGSGPLPNQSPSLLICPTSVIGNWRREVARFAPSLSTLVHHGANRNPVETFAEVSARHDLVITSYALAHRDLDVLRSVEWDMLILDEAQNIKNSGARQSKAVRQLHSRFRVALTGTPVENRLAELWSIMDFLNPGYLGSRDVFRKLWAIPIEQARNPEAIHRLKSLVKPFILRRLKTDPVIISDLPEKWEMKELCPLTTEQATLYEAVVKDALEQIASAEGIARKGVILAAITKLKQVCNHPAHFLKDGSRLDGRSGKLMRLTEMLQEVVSAGDSALVFTQFAEMGSLLQAHLETSLGCRTLFLHGGVSASARDEMVRQFQTSDGPPVFLLSLKAGGVGLNLTRASQVFHFDRWWNPAVENQATDRAFRIGQKKHVQVYKFICEGTIEEAIDREMDNKLQLAESVIGVGENWLTELSTEQLREMLRLRRDTVIEEAET